MPLTPKFPASESSENDWQIQSGIWQAGKFRAPLFLSLWHTASWPAKSNETVLQSEAKGPLSRVPSNQKSCRNGQGLWEPIERVNSGRQLFANAASPAGPYCTNTLIIIIISHHHPSERLVQAPRRPPQFISRPSGLPRLRAGPAGVWWRVHAAAPGGGGRQPRRGARGARPGWGAARDVPRGREHHRHRPVAGHRAVAPAGLPSGGAAAPSATASVCFFSPSFPLSALPILYRHLLF